MLFDVKDLLRRNDVTALLPHVTHDVADILQEFLQDRHDWPGFARIDKPSQLAAIIDHTLLKPTASVDDVRVLCEQAVANRFKSVCVNPTYVMQCAYALDGSGIEVCTVVGFPLGATTTIAKAVETTRAIADGATEIDMVVNQGDVLGGHWDDVIDDVRAVCDASGGALVKVIIETCNLNMNAKVGACVAAALGGADFVKTSTGFAASGATAEDISLMRLVVGAGLGVKASGGIRSTDDALTMVAAGANRIGASASIAIVEGFKAIN